jgi:hypothetical protein
MKSFGSKPNGNFAKLKISQKKSATTSNLLPGPLEGQGRNNFQKGYWFYRVNVFNPKRGVHGVVRETLSTVGGCASNLKAGRRLGNLGEEQQARGQGAVASAALKFQRQISATCERNEPQRWLFILRCNTSWIVRISCTPH